MADSENFPHEPEVIGSESRIYRQKDVDAAEKRGWAEVLAACIEALKDGVPLGAGHGVGYIYNVLSNLQPAASDLEGLLKQSRLEVLAACLAELDIVSAIYAENKERPEETRLTIAGVCRGIYYRLKALQPAASDLEGYVKNLPLSEIARIKGIPGVAKLGKTYNRPDFYATEDE